ncbi:helix-turn-helix domain-containing protein [Hespellia stercorisuis]|uniref:DNA-binding transcriptional regulator, XRE-family HTH domain n=1 Tax=Hespellia stercorisuis DSM 15480 TaxID=1121950 RepID=A0A1M6KH80_9FIRM|nr:helix-turn-helix transcriptional regulator [Hespellia stercorisuis]SHJ58314.1 DNA-binding transcriptional regulator, XRE-family HTH domain [Hespellia stercorisuis DSM 15480]
MSFLNLNSNIVRLRKESGITQEELAAFAGVTKASVSKWETGTTTPDITLLPVLAAYFDVSVDQLLGYEAQLNRQQIRIYYHRLAEDFAKKPFDEVWKNSIELAKKYYCCYPFLMQIVILWLNHASLAQSEEQRNSVMQEAEKLCDHIMKSSDNGGIRENVSAFRRMIWLQTGRPQLVIEELEQETMDVNRVGDRGAMLPMAYMYTGNIAMAEKSSQIGIYRNLMELIGGCSYLLMSCPGKREYCLEIIRRTDQILETFQVGKLHPNSAGIFYYQAAVSLCSLPEGTDADTEAAIYEHLEKYVEMIRQLCEDGIKLHADTFFFSLEDWLGNLELGKEPVRDGKLVLEGAVESLKSPVFLVLPDQKKIAHYIRQIKDMERLL